MALDIAGITLSLTLCEPCQRHSYHFRHDAVPAGAATVTCHPPSPHGRSQLDDRGVVSGGFEVLGLKGRQEQRLSRLGDCYGSPGPKNQKPCCSQKWWLLSQAFQKISRIETRPLSFVGKAVFASDVTMYKRLVWPGRWESISADHQFFLRWRVQKLGL